MADTERRQNLRYTLFLFSGGHMHNAIPDVLLRSQMGKKCKRLEDIPNLPLLHGNINSISGIKQYARPENNPPLIWPHQSGNTVEQRGLPCSGWSKQYREAAFDQEIDFEREL